MELALNYKNDVYLEQKEILIVHLNKLFSNPPSSYGYRHDIEMLLNELYIDDSNYFKIVTDCLLKENRNKDEIKIIASYLFFMQEFVKVLSDKEVKKKETEILSNLINLSGSIFYQEIPKNVVLMRYGEKGSKAYINLGGDVDVLIKSSKSMKVYERDYLYYLACLIKYNEFALINLVINDNFFNYPLIIYDDIESKTQILSIIESINRQKARKFTTFIKIQNDEIKKIRVDSNLLLNKSKIKLEFKKKKSITDPSTFIDYFTPGNIDIVQSQKNQGLNLRNSFKLNVKNEDLKNKIEPYLISSKQLLDLFGLKYLDKKDNELNNCSTEEYKNRINVIPVYQEKVVEKKDKEKEKDKDKDKEKETDLNKSNNSKKSNESDDSIYQLVIYSYSKVIALGKGNLFGELALRSTQAVRTATIITSSICHFSYLNKTTFNNCLRISTETHLNQQLSFFINLPIFIDIPITSFYKKYFTNISKHYIPKNHFILKQGEKPTRICLLNRGVFILISTLNLNELTDLIFHLIKKIKKYNSQIEHNKDYNEIFLSLSKSVEEEKKLIRDNMPFKNFYYTESLIRISEISCPDITGYYELVDENGLYAFSVQAKTNENIIYTMELNFYNDLYSKNNTVQKHHEELLIVKLDLILRRLLKIRNNTLSSFFNHKIETDIGSVISKELEEVKTTSSKLKRFLHFKSTKCNFFNKTEDSSFMNDIYNDKEQLKEKVSSYLRLNKKKTKEMNNIFTMYNNNLILRNNSQRKRYKDLILPKTKLVVKKKKKNFFDTDTSVKNNKKEENLIKNINKSYKKSKEEKSKSNSKSKDKIITNRNINEIDTSNNDTLNLINKKMNDILPLFKRSKNVQTEYSKVKYRKIFTENSNEIKGKKINNSYKVYFDKKYSPSNPLIRKILKQKRRKLKSENNKINHNINHMTNTQKDSVDLLMSNTEYKKNYKNDSNYMMNSNEIAYSILNLKKNVRNSTPKNLKFNLLLLNNKSITYTNKESFVQKSLKMLAENHKKEEKQKEEEIKGKITSTDNIINKKKDKDKEDYIFKRDNYYKKNLMRMKFFYGLK